MIASLTTILDSFNPNWSDYYKFVAGRSPRETLIAALNYFEAEPSLVKRQFTVDLGCGEGRDTVELLRRGWYVLAIDKQPEAFQHLLSRTDLQATDHLEIRLARFEETNWPEADLINASNSLPFCPPESFPVLWEQIVQSIRPGGRFAGQFFGEREALARYPTLTHHTIKQIETLFHFFEIEYFKEVEHDKQTPFGYKHCHLFHVVARKL